MMFHKLSLGVAIAALTVAFGSVSPAAAATTVVNPVGGSTGGERCLIGNGANCAAGGTYGGAASIQTILEADVGTLARVDDDFDQIWQTLFSGPGLVLGRARYAGLADTLGYIDSAAGPLAPFNTLLGIATNNTVFVDAGNPYLPESDVVQLGSTTFTAFTPSSAFRFALMRPDGVILSSKDADNPFGMDQMVTLVAVDPTAGGSTVSDGNQTYEVQARYIIAFEDIQSASRGSLPGDHDYNDYVFELVNVKPVPVPAAIPLFLSGLAGVGLIARRRKA